jgi:hypothetical protein
MKTHARLMIFSLTACIVYTLAYYFNWSLFRYYLATGTIDVSAPDAAGPPILWYGWLATALLAGAAAAFLVPRRAIGRMSPELAWLVPSIALLAALMYELRWFL